MEISAEKAALISIFVESTFYGLFLALYAVSTVLLFRGGKEMKLKTPMMAITFGMLCFSTLHVANAVHRVVEAFLDPGRPANVYLNLSNTPSEIINLTSYAAQTLLADGFLLYRVYIVWGKNRWIAFPLAASLLASGAVAIIGINDAASATGPSAISNPALRRFILTFGILTLVLNFSSSCLIAGKIWWVHRRSSSLRRAEPGSGPSLSTPMVLIIESCAFYSICLILQMTVHASGSFACNIVFDSMPSIIGFTLSLLIVRLEFVRLSAAAKFTREVSQSSERSNSARNQDFASSYAGSARRPVTVCKCRDATSMQPIEVRLSRRIDQPGEPDGLVSSFAKDSDELSGRRNIVND